MLLQAYGYTVDGDADTMNALSTNASEETREHAQGNRPVRRRDRCRSLNVPHRRPARAGCRPVRHVRGLGFNGTNCLGVLESYTATDADFTPINSVRLFE